MKLKLKINKAPQKAPVTLKESNSTNVTGEVAKNSPQAGELRESALSEVVDSHISKVAAEFNMPVEFIERGFDCCRRLGMATEFFINRYLKRDGTPFNSEFEAVYKEILNEQRMKLWTIQ